MVNGPIAATEMSVFLLSPGLWNTFVFISPQSADFRCLETGCTTLTVLKGKGISLTSESTRI